MIFHDVFALHNQKMPQTSFLILLPQEEKPKPNICWGVGENKNSLSFHHVQQQYEARRAEKVWSCAVK